MTHRRPLRAPFVVTLLTAASLDACTSGGAGGGGCPGSVPASGDSCDGDERCTYDGHPCPPYGPSGTTATCIAGRWSVGYVSCNPPAPPPAPCPAAAPSDGSSCEYSPFMRECTYAHPTCPTERDAFMTAVCAGGSWRVQTPACGTRPSPPSPNPAACPVEAPTRTAPCDAPGVECGYGDCMGGHAVRAICDPGERRWRYRYADARCSPAPPACPESAPADGDRCDGAHPNGFLGEAVCHYAACDGRAVPTARCGEATGFAWRVGDEVCEGP